MHLPSPIHARWASRSCRFDVVLRRVPKVNLQVYEFTGYYSPKSLVIELW